MTNGEKPPSAFISYCRADGMDWPRHLAADLRRNGIAAIIDQWADLGESLSAFTALAKKADFVLVLCTPRYRGKLEDPTNEGDYISAEITNARHSTEIPVLWKGSLSEAVPAHLADRVAADFRDGSRYEPELERLLRCLFGMRDPTQPELGRRPPLGNDGRLVLRLGKGASDSKPPAVQPPEFELAEVESVWPGASEAPDSLPSHESPPSTLDKVARLQHGVLLVANLADDVPLAGRDLGAVMQRLSQFVDSHRLVTASGAERCGSLDGIVVCFATCDCDSVLEFARQMLEHVLDGAPRGQLRVALHLGAFQAFQGTHRLLIGGALRACARLVRLADPGHIILSEEFVQSWRSHEGDRMHAQVSPIYPCDPIEVFMRPNTSQRLRIFDPDGTVSAPRELLVLQATRDRLFDLLRHIGKTFVRVVHEMSSGASGNSGNSGVEAKRNGPLLRPRLTIYVPAPNDGGLLIPTTYCIRGEKVTESPPQVYRVSEVPIGRAAYRMEAQVVQGSPENRPRSDKAVKKPRRLPSSKVSAVRNRAWLALPFALVHGAKRADGVVSLECSGLLQSIETDALEVVGKAMVRDYSLPLAALWQVRYSA